MKTSMLTANHRGFDLGFDVRELLMPKHVAAFCVAGHPAPIGAIAHEASINK
ncbi:MAG: hypothetical protein RIS79_564 [Verrucomicrobiota bacterium]|jgi:hypothetical protein